MEINNFEYVKEIFPEVYDNLSKAEKTARIDVRTSGHFLRDALESWCNYLIQEFSIKTESALADKINALLQAKKLPGCGTQSYKYINKKGQRAKETGYNIWRLFGNECSHAGGTSNLDNPKVNYRQLILVFSLSYEVFKSEYQRIQHKNIGKNAKFKEHFIPIGNNQILEAIEPTDAHMSGCLMEYRTIAEDDKTHMVTYSIIREYRKDIIENQLRGYEAPFLANSYKGFFNNVQISLLPPDEYWEENEKCYIVYSFMNQPMRVSNSFFVKNHISLKEVKELVLGIAMRLQQFHKVDPPIYHRNLSYDSVYVCKQGNGTYEPSIIKFDYAKIMYGTTYTVVDFVDSVRDSGDKRIRKYRAPEVDEFFEEKKEEPSWEKVDIYSLGMLAGELLKRRLTDTIPSREELVRHKVPENIAEIIENMLNEKPAERPDIDQLIEALRGWEILT